jgi:hypothetical protein
MSDGWFFGRPSAQAQPASQGVLGARYTLCAVQVPGRWQKPLYGRLGLLATRCRHHPGSAARVKGQQKQWPRQRPCTLKDIDVH